MSDAAKMSDKSCARVVCQPVLLGATAAKSVSRTFAGDRHDDTNPHSNPSGGALRC